MRKIFVTVIILLSTLKCFSQINLVPNPSFESYDSCPYNDGQITFANSWFQPYTPQSSSDYLNICSPDTILGVPQNAYGYQLAKTGDAYASITAGYFIFSSNYREYIEAELIDTLQTNKHYCVSFYASFVNRSKKACDGMGAYLSPGMVTYSTPPWGVLNLIPQLQNPSGNILDDTANWVLISDTILAQGGEKFITIGNFTNDANINYIQNNYGVYNYSQYYIDDVSVILCDSTVGINEISNPIDFVVYPNPAKNEITIKNLTPFQTVSIKDLTGKNIYSLKSKTTVEHISLLNISDGMYIIEVSNNFERVFQSKFVVIK